MNRDELNSRTEVIDLKAGVLFVQTENGTYGVYDPQKKVVMGQKCQGLAEDVFNEMVLGELAKHVLNEKTIDQKGSLIGLEVDDAFYAVDFSTRQFICSENWEDIEKIMNKGILDKKGEISNFVTQMMNDDMGNTLAMETANGEKLYKVMDVYGNSYSSNNLSAAMFDLTRVKDALSILNKERGTIDLTFLNNYKMGPEMLDFRSVNADTVSIKFKMNGRWEPEELLSKKKLLGVISSILLEVDSDCLEKHLINSKKEKLSILIQGENAYESKELQDEMGIYKGRKLSL